MPDGNFGSTVTGCFNDVTKAYKDNPTIENYVKLRRSMPDAEIEISVIGGIEQMFYMEAELKKYDINPRLVLGAMDANEHSVSELSLQIMEKIIESRRLSRLGETHLVRRGLVIPEKLVDWIIACALDAMSWNDAREIPRDLIVLIRERLGGSNPEYEQASWAREQKHRASMIGGQLRARGIKPTLRILGQALSVAPSTVKRWFSEGELEIETERWAHMFDGDGKLLPLEGSSAAVLREKQDAQR